MHLCEKSWRNWRNFKLAQFVSPVGFHTLVLPSQVFGHGHLYVGLCRVNVVHCSQEEALINVVNKSIFVDPNKMVLD